MMFRIMRNPTPENVNRPEKSDSGARNSITAKLSWNFICCPLSLSLYIYIYISLSFSLHCEEKLKHSSRGLLGDCFCIANCRTNVCAIFRGIIENFRGNSAFLFIYFTISPGTLVGKHCSRATVKPTQLFARWVLRALSSGVKRPDREAIRSPPCIGEVTNASSPPHAFTVSTCTSSVLYRWKNSMILLETTSRSLCWLKTVFSLISMQRALRARMLLSWHQILDIWKWKYVKKILMY
jgi:hypothetical protein